MPVWMKQKLELRFPGENERREKLELIVKLLKLSELGELTALLGKLN